LETIDELWFLCGWIDRDKEAGQRALRRQTTASIKQDVDAAVKHTDNLLHETPCAEFKAHLSTLERRISPKH
jgi:hypothetical protein